MSSDRYVLLGLARPRTPWFAEVTRWATSAVIPAEFVKCVSPEELRARLEGGRRWSAVLLDGALPSVDRDLLADVRESGCVPVVVDDRETEQRWQSIGAASVLPTVFDRSALLDVLDAVAVAVGQPTDIPSDAPRTEGHVLDRAFVVAVCGPGGTGASIAAASLAQGLAATGRDTLLADLARHAEQALLHDVRDVVPGVQELVEAHRNGVPTAEDVRNLTFAIADRGYSLLLGLRRARYWPALRPRAFSSAFDSICRAFDIVVCDITADFEGEVDAGSADVEDRNLASLTAVADADVVVVVGRPGVKGIHALVRVLGDLVATGVQPARILPVISMAPRSPRARAEISAALGELARPALGGSATPSPVFLPTRPVEQATRDGAPIPTPLPSRLAGGVLGVAANAGPVRRHRAEPVAVAPGSLGSFTERDDE